MIIPLSLSKEAKLRKGERMFELKPTIHHKIFRMLEIEVFEHGKFLCWLAIPDHIYKNDELLNDVVIQAIREVEK